MSKKIALRELGSAYRCTLYAGMLLSAYITFQIGVYMRKTINILALLFLLWLTLDTFNTPSLLLNFLIVGKLPGLDVFLSPSMMLAIMTASGGIVIFELLARRIEVIWRIRQHFKTIIERQERLPKRRFSKI